MQRPKRVNACAPNGTPRIKLNNSFFVDCACAGACKGPNVSTQAKGDATDSTSGGGGEGGGGGNDRSQEQQQQEYYRFLGLKISKDDLVTITLALAISYGIRWCAAGWGHREGRVSSQMEAADRR
eukprot:353876-Chlamydomonas_euryale.AAC.8